MNPKIGAVILAAGTASRMGRQKLLLPLSGKPLLAHVLNVVHGMSWADCVAVIGEPQDELAQLCGQYNIRTVYNAARHSGQASSIVLAMNSLSNRLDGVIFFRRSAIDIAGTHLGAYRQVPAGGKQQGNYCALPPGTAVQSGAVRQPLAARFGRLGR